MKLSKQIIAEAVDYNAIADMLMNASDDMENAEIEKELVDLGLDKSFASDIPVWWFSLPAKDRSRPTFDAKGAIMDYVAKNGMEYSTSKLDLAMTKIEKKPVAKQATMYKALLNMLIQKVEELPNGKKILKDVSVDAIEILKD